MDLWKITCISSLCSIDKYNINLLLLPIFPPSSHSIVVFLSCRPFVVEATFSTGLVGCWSFSCLLSTVSTAQARRQKNSEPKKTYWECRVNDERPTGKKNNYWMGRRWKIGNKNKNYSNWNLPIGAWNMIFKSIDFWIQSKYLHEYKRIATIQSDKCWG